MPSSSSPPTRLRPNSTQKVSFHFVVGNPQNESERRNARTIVRSNASNRRWRQVRETAARAKAQAQTKATDDNQDEPMQDSDAVSSEAQSDDVVIDMNMSHRIPNDEEQSSVCSSERRTSFATSNDGFGETEDAPTVRSFAPNYAGHLPSEISSLSISRTLYGAAAVYTQLFPGGNRGEISVLAKDWFQRCLTGRGALHCALFCQTMRFQALCPELHVLSGKELVLCQTEAVHALTRKLQKLESACDDDSIRIVCSLTWHGGIRLDDPPRWPSQAPLRELQYLHVFGGKMDQDPLHADALAKMIELRGGIDKIGVPGLGFMCSYGDIIWASRNLTRPRWPYQTYAQHDPNARPLVGWEAVTDRSEHPLRELGTGFSSVTLWMHEDIAEVFQEVVIDMARYTRAVDDFMNARPEAQNLAVLTDKRNFAEHRLMSLCPSTESDSEHDYLFELCWLAAVAYSFIVIWPIAPRRAQFPRLATRIRLAMGSNSVRLHWIKAPGLLLWITTIGAISAISTPDREWYVGTMERLTMRLRVSNWAHLRSILMKFLWLPTVSDGDGHELWKEIEKSCPFGS